MSQPVWTSIACSLGRDSPAGPRLPIFVSGGRPEGRPPSLELFQGCHGVLVHLFLFIHPSPPFLGVPFFTALSLRHHHIIIVAH